MNHKARILIVDDDPIVAESLAEFLADEGYATATAGDGQEALDLIESAGAKLNGTPFGIVIADLNMPRCDGIELLRNLSDGHPSVVPIVITGFGKIESAVESVKHGAVDYLTKPVVDDELRMAVNKAVNHHALMAENQTLRSQLNDRYGLANLVGSDYRMQKVYDLVEAVSQSKTTVLITGESGTGKTVVARAIHTLSERDSGPFLTFSCGAIPETLLESELFGHVKGAFTGADSDKPGKCLAANGGTLFIDEVNAATQALQVKMLRVLQEKQFEPVGSTTTIGVDVRFVLASNQPLADLVEKGDFREDLYYRINVVNIHMPRLCERSGDVPILAEHFLEKYCHEMNRHRNFSHEVMEVLQLYHWPGNVRELENAVERAVLLSRGSQIEVGDLPDPIRMLPGGLGAGSSVGRTEGEKGGVVQVSALAEGWTPTPLSVAMQAPERQIIHAALDANNWNRQETAKQLDINRTTLYKKIKQYGLDEPN